MTSEFRKEGIRFHKHQQEQIKADQRHGGLQRREAGNTLGLNTRILGDPNKFYKPHTNLSRAAVSNNAEAIISNQSHKKFVHGEVKGLGI